MSIASPNRRRQLWGAGVTVPETVGGFGTGFGGLGYIQANDAAPDHIQQVQTVPTAPSPPPKPKPVRHSVFALVPYHRLAPYLAFAYRASAAVYSLRALPEGSLTVGALIPDNCDFIHAEIRQGLVGSSALRENWASAALAGVGSFVRECLDLSGDEPYSGHRLGPLVGLYGFPNCIGIYRLIFANRFWDCCRKSA